MAIVGNLHLDADSANLVAHAPHQNRHFRGKLTQFCGDARIGCRDAEHTQAQAQYLYLSGLCKIGRGDTDKLALQVRQKSGFGQQRTKFLVTVQQSF